MRTALIMDTTGWTLFKYTELRYRKNGKANIHVKIQYCIEHDNSETGVFWIQTKRDAMNEWRRFKKSNFRNLNGTPIVSLSNTKVGDK